MQFNYTADHESRLYIAHAKTFNADDWQYARGYLREYWLSREWSRIHLKGAYQVNEGDFLILKTKRSALFYFDMFFMRDGICYALQFSRSLDYACMNCDVLPGKIFGITGPLSSLVRARYAVLSGAIPAADLPGVRVVNALPPSETLF